MNAPTPGLGTPRRLRLDKHQVAKVDVTVQPGDEIVAAGVVGDQLEAAGMTDVAPAKKAAAKKAPAKKAPAKKAAARKTAA
jgi:hypothetical protein